MSEDLKEYHIDGEPVTGSADWELGVTHRGTDAECKAKRHKKTGEVWLLNFDGTPMLRVHACAVGYFSPNA